MKYSKQLISTLILVSCSVILHSQDVDAISGASIYNNGRQLSREEIIDLILNKHNDRVLVIGTTNVDGTPNSGIFTLTSIDSILMIYGNNDQLTVRNLKRTKTALVTLYKIPYKGEIYSKHLGARITVELIEDKNRIKFLEEKKGIGKEVGMWNFLKIVKIKPLG